VRLLTTNARKLAEYRRRLSAMPREHAHEIEGHVDLSRREPAGRGVLDWDDVFVPMRTLRSYHEKAALGLKLSGRDLVLDDFVREHLWYRRPVQPAREELLAARAQRWDPLRPGSWSTTSSSRRRWTGPRARS